MIRISKIFVAMAVVLVISISLVGYPSMERSNDELTKAGRPDGSEPLFGKLVTVGNESLLVNGVMVPSGTTIMAGSQIETPDQFGAAVVLRSLGRVDIGPKTTLVLEFAPNEININLVKGCVILTTIKGTKGSVKNPQGITKSIGPAEDSSLNLCADESPTSVVTLNKTGPKTYLSPWLFALGGLPFISAHSDSNTSKRPEPVL